MVIMIESIMESASGQMACMIEKCDVLWQWHGNKTTIPCWIKNCGDIFRKW